MKSFDNEMIQIRNELLNLKSYITKKTSVFKTEEYSFTASIKLDTNASSTVADGPAIKLFKTENGSTALACASISKSFLDGIYEAELHFYPSVQKDLYDCWVYIETTNQQIIDRINNGETITVNVPFYITTTSTFVEVL